jgi:GMP synthase-like glutamine amidotransferase
MHIHWFQHDDFEDMAQIETWAKAKGHSTSVTRFDLSPVFPEMQDIDWLIIMGGKMGAYEDAEYPWLTEEKKFIKGAIEKGKVVLGICLGAQLVAASLGARVYRNTEPETGFFPVYFNNEAQNDPVFRHFTSQLTVLHVHNDTFDIPMGARLMASSEATPHQAFRFKDKVIAFQFHFEVNTSCLPNFFRNIPSHQGANQWVQDRETILKSAYECDRNNLIFNKILDAIAEIEIVNNY